MQTAGRNSRDIRLKLFSESPIKVILNCELIFTNPKRVGMKIYGLWPCHSKGNKPSTECCVIFKTRQNSKTPVDTRHIETTKIE